MSTFNQAHEMDIIRVSCRDVIHAEGFEDYEAAGVKHSMGFM